jgi:single-stranded-DNA-specific exonuclease
LTLLHTHWRIAEPPSKQDLDQFPDVDPLLVQVLFNRKIATPAAVEEFLSPLPPELYDPFQLKGMEAAVTRIRAAIENRERIVIYGDYDADGVTGSVLLTQALRAMGAVRVQPYIPHREKEGYGLNRKALDELAAQGNRLIITTDCGIRGVEPIEHAGRLGLEVIVTDHHAPGPELPPATAIIDPKQPGDTYPDRMLAGVGIAFKLVQGLVQAGLELDGLEEDDLLDLVAIGTVADLAPLLKENRLLVRRGLEVLNNAGRPGVAALFKHARVRPGQATATTIGYTLGPRINAAGRVDHAYQAARLLITEDPAAADSLAAELTQLNRQRQETTREMTRRALEQALAQAEDTPLLFAAHADYPSGIVGLIASRLLETRYRPAIAAQIRGDLTVGSCRSIEEFHITAALDQIGDILVKHGGHRRAAGFTVETKNLPEFQERLTAIAAEQLDGRDLMPRLDIDVTLGFKNISWKVQESLARLEPCGIENPVPLLLSPGVCVANTRRVGKDRAHLKLTLKDGGRTFDGIAFRMGDKEDEVQERMDIVYRLEENEWNGRRRLQLNIQDMRPAGEE